MSQATYYIQECPTCGRRLQIRVKHLGKLVACLHCQAIFEARDPDCGLPPPSDSGVYLLKRADELLAAVAEKAVARR